MRTFRAHTVRAPAEIIGEPTWKWSLVQVASHDRFPSPIRTDAGCRQLSKILKEPVRIEGPIQSADRTTGDERQTWRWIFGFPKNKPGPGGLFDQDRALEKEMAQGLFAMFFAGRLYDGQDPVEAREEAANDVFGADGPDDRTLQRYLEEFLDNTPTTVEELRETGLRIMKKVAEPYRDN